MSPHSSSKIDAPLTGEQLAAAFRQPPSGFGPNPAWWWCGERLTPERLEWQMRQFRAGGLDQITIISISPHWAQHGYPPDDPPFYSEEWWRCFLHVAHVADELGMRLWYFDHIGTFPTRYPVDLITQHPEFAARQLARLPGVAELPPDAEVLREDPEYTYFNAPIPYRDQYSAPDFYDLCNPAAGAALIDAIHGEMERRLGSLFSRVIGGSFQDELRALPSWAPDLPAAYRERTGRALVDCLPALFDASAPDPGARSGYHQALAELAEDAFFRPLYEWHDSRGLIVVCDQLFRTRTGDPLHAQAAYHDYARTHRWFNGLGNDHNGEVKVHSSLVHLYGRPRTFLEGFHSSGWGGTLEETFQWLLPWLQQGSTLYGPHATYYTTKGGWLEWAPPDTAWRQPYWQHYPYFNETVARLCWLLTQGMHCCDVALFYPASAVQAELSVPLSSYHDYLSAWRESPFSPQSRSEPAKEIARVFWEIAGNVSWRWHGVVRRDDRVRWQGALEKTGQDFDVIDEDSLARAEVHDGRLQVSGEAYHVLIFPQTTHLPRAALEQAWSLVQDGGLVAFVGCAPTSTCEGGADDPNLHHLLRALLGERGSGREHESGGAAALLPDADALAAWLNARLTPPVRGEVRALHRRVEDMDVYLIIPDRLAPPPPERENRLVGMAPGDAEALVRAAVERPSTPERLTVSIHQAAPRQVGAVEQWDPTTGEARPARVLAQEGGWTTLELDFTAAPAVIVVFGHQPQAALAPAAGTPHVTQLAETWRCELIPTVDNRYGDFAWPPSPGPLPVETRTLQATVESALGERKVADVRCGFAGWVEVHPPTMLEAGQAPQPPKSDAEWQPYAYSLQIGIEKDPIHRQTLGPRYRVPPEFLDFGPQPEGVVCWTRTYAIAPMAIDARLRLVGNGAWWAWVNGQLVTSGSGELVEAVHLAAGPNRIELGLAATEATGSARLRGGFQFLLWEAQRPYGHPLPDVPEWLNYEGPSQHTPNLSLDPHPERAPRQVSWTCCLPPGAHTLRVSVGVPLSAWVDGAPVPLTRSDDEQLIGCLPNPAGLHRRLTLTGELPAGLLDGAAFLSPLRFECGPGQIELGAWREEGLSNYAGGVRYIQEVDLAELPGRLELDLGRVRGTAEVRLNGTPCGVRLWSPYRFDLTESAQVGANRLEIDVYGTLGTYFLEGHPSPGGFRSQALLGLLGPVTLRHA